MYKTDENLSEMEMSISALPILETIKKINKIDYEGRICDLWDDRRNEAAEFG